MTATGGRSRFGAWLRAAVQAHWEVSGGGGVRGLMLAALLSPLSWGYAGVQRLRRGLYRARLLPRHRLPCPVVSVGGIRVGGSGKTPFVRWMARRLAEGGLRVAILTRGYGRGAGGTTFLHGCDTAGRDAATCGDEPLMLARALPEVWVVVDGDRVRGARRTLERTRVDLFLLDDGFQHLRLARSCDIVLHPEEENPSRMHCLPRGPLREPVSALRDADLFVSMGGKVRGKGRGRSGPCRLPSFSAALGAEAVYTLDGATRIDPAVLAGKRVLAFCGIARPAAFWRTLEGMDLSLTERLAFPDHHPYGEDDRRFLAGKCAGADWAITTEKDAVKLSGHAWPRENLLFVRLALALRGEGDFWDRIEERTGLSVRGAGRREVE